MNICCKQNNEATEYYFVNTFRVNEFTQLLKIPENQNQNILNLAFEAGFNSKSSFNAAFRKKTGVSPRQYRQSLSLNK